MTYNSIESAGKVLELLELSQEATTTFKVREQDQDTPTVILKFNQVANQTTLSSTATKDSYDIEVSDPTGIIAGKYIILFSPTDNRAFFGYCKGIASSTVTLDSKLDFSYPAGSYVDVGITNFNVNGSSTAQTFGLRGVGDPTGVPSTVDINKIKLSCICSSPVDLSKFGDIAELTRGVLIRHRTNDGIYNILNIKSNLEIGNIFDDWTPYAALNPAQGVDGFVATLTFNGQDNMSVVKRLETGEDLEIIIQDNLTAITVINAIAEGHVVQ